MSVSIKKEIFALPDLFNKDLCFVIWLPEFGGLQENYRQQIRQCLFESLAEKNFFPDPESILNLEELPSQHGLSISISHSNKMSLYGWCHGSKKLGLDVEEVSRVEPRIVLRVSSAGEVALSPMPAHLWTAKESVLKSLNSPLNLITNVEIFDWKNWGPTEWFFSARLKSPNTIIQGIGFTSLRMEHSFSFFLRTP